MRAKFGGSAGLNTSGSGGKMSAMGSDPGYKPGGNSGGGINTAEVEKFILCNVYKFNLM